MRRAGSMLASVLLCGLLILSSSHGAADEDASKRVHMITIAPYDHELCLAGKPQDWSIPEAAWVLLDENRSPHERREALKILGTSEDGAPAIEEWQKRLKERTMRHQFRFEPENYGHILSWKSKGPWDGRLKAIAEGPVTKEGQWFAFTGLWCFFGTGEIFFVARLSPEGSWERPAPVRKAADKSLQEFAEELLQDSKELERCLSDEDGDHMTDLAEELLGTNPHEPDTDGDGMIDGSDPTPLRGLPETESGGDEGQILQQAFFAVFGTNSSLQGVFFVPSEMPACEGFAGRLLHGVDLGGPDRRYAPLVNMKIDSMSEDTAVVGMTIWLAELAGQAWKMTVVKRSGTWLISDIKDMGVW